MHRLPLIIYLNLFLFFLVFSPPELFAARKIVTRRIEMYRSHQPYRNYWSTPYGRWNGSRFGWPSYYAYYGYPIQGSIYYYSYPMNSSFYYSYPSTYTNWTYPSYPYVGKYYVNQTPFYPKRTVPRRIAVPYNGPQTPLHEYVEPGYSTGVFIGE